MKLTILIVDGDRAVRQPLAAQLIEEGFAVKQADGIGDARARLADGGVDLMVIDAKLPDGAGIDYVAELRHSKRIQRVPPIFFVTGAAPDAATLTRLTRDLQVDRVLIKPLDLEALLFQIDQLGDITAVEGVATIVDRAMAGLAAAAVPDTHPDVPLKAEAHAPGPDAATSAGAAAGSAGAPGPEAEAARAFEAEAAQVFEEESAQGAEAKAGDEVAGEAEVIEAVASGPVPRPGVLQGMATEEEPPPLPPDPQAGVSSRALDDELAQLRAEFGEALVEKLNRLKQMLTNAHKTVEVTGQLEQAHRLAHDIHGSAGSYGFMEVSAAASLVENALGEMLAGDVDRRAIRVWRQIDAAIERAELAADGHPTVENTAPLPTRHTTTILAVDEDPDFLAHAQRIGRDSLVHVLVAQTAQRALQIAAEHRIDGAIVDLSLGRREGIEDCFGLARRLRALDGCAALPLAVISERDDLPDRLEAVHAGVTFFLNKPLPVEDLLATASRFTAIRTAARPRLLLVDQDPRLSVEIGRLLGDWSVQHLGQPQRLLEELERQVPDALLLEVALPQVSGFDLCRLVRSVPRWQDLPVLFIAGEESSRAARVACFEAGGDDYVEREQLDDELLARLQVRLDRVRLKREAAERDHLTGLLTRGSFLTAVEARLGENRRSARPLALALIGIDGAFGDDEPLCERVTARLGRLLADRFRVGDLRSRWPGGEFVIALNGELPDNARRILHRLLAEFRRMRFVGGDGGAHLATFSAGIAGFPRDGSEVGTLIRVADQRLAEARAEGPGRILA